MATIATHYDGSERTKARHDGSGGIIIVAAAYYDGPGIQGAAMSYSTEGHDLPTEREQEHWATVVHSKHDFF
ncbi:hypothetical protein ACFX13_041078 [Malus domestica]